MKIAEDLYSYIWTNPYENNCNSYYLGGKVQALIDPGLKKHVPGLLEKMEADGIRAENIRYVINTHCHPDHYQGAESFNGPGIERGLHREEIAFLDTIGRDMFQWFELDFPEVDINLPLSEGDIALGGESFQILLIPGHSPGSIGLYWPERRVLISGDVVFDQNVGRTDFPGGDSALLKESIRRLAALDVDLLLPGHMGIVAGDDKVSNNFRLIINRIFPYL